MTFLSMFDKQNRKSYVSAGVKDFRRFRVNHFIWLGETGTNWITGYCCLLITFIGNSLIGFVYINLMLFGFVLSMTKHHSWSKQLSKYKNKRVILQKGESLVMGWVARFRVPVKTASVKLTLHLIFGSCELIPLRCLKIYRLVYVGF